MASTNKSSSNKKNKHEISYKQFLSCLSNLDDNIDFSKFTADAVEALRLCHMEFVSLLASELAHQREDNALDHRDKGSMSNKPIQEIHVEKCMKDLHYDSLLERTLHEVELRDGGKRLNNSKDSRSKKKSKKKKICDEAYEEQELLLQSYRSSDAKVEISVSDLEQDKQVTFNPKDENIFV